MSPQLPATQHPLNGSAQRLRRQLVIASICAALAAAVAGGAALHINPMESAIFPSPRAVPLLAAICGIGFAAPLASLWASLFGPRAAPRALIQPAPRKVALAFAVSSLLPVFVFYGLPVPMAAFQVQAVLALAAAPTHLAGAIWCAVILALPLVIAYPFTAAILRSFSSAAARAVVFVGLFCGLYALLTLLGIHLAPDAAAISGAFLN